MNPITKDGSIPKVITDLWRAENSPRLRALYERWGKRFCAKCAGYYFPMEVDQFGNSFVNADKFGLDGVIAYEIHLWRYFRKQCEKGEMGFNPRKMFERASLQQMTQTETEGQSLTLRAVSGAAHTSAPTSS